MKNLDEIVQAIAQQLTPQERSGAVAYVRTDLIAAGTPLPQYPGLGTAPDDSYLAFIDRQPLANWGHSCRFVLLSAAGMQALSAEARFPFPRAEAGTWRTAYRAEGVPDAALLVP